MNELGDWVSRFEWLALKEQYESAVRALQDIAAMGQKAGSETAKHRLMQLGEPREAGGYIAGKGFNE